MSIILGTVFIVLMLLAVPIGICLGITAMVGMLMGGISIDYISKTAYTAIDSFAIIAVPMFILAGAIMEKGGLTSRLINFSKAIVGDVSGGLAIVTVVACTLFAAISGSGPATTAAIGSILIPAMVHQGYSRGFAGGIAACSGGLGVVIPPSILMIIYGISAEQSITGLFLAGILPGLLLAVFLVIAIVVVSKIKGYKGTGEKRSWKTFASSALNARWALLSPVLILGGIYGGVVTVTEASIVAVVYSLLVGFFIYRELDWEGFVSAILYTAKTTGTVFIVLMMGTVIGRVLTMYQIPQMVSEALVTTVSNKIALILLVDALLLFIGMWMESITMIVILTPLLLPAMIAVGVHPIQFGIMFTIACEIGYETPPLGVNLFVAKEIAGTSIEDISLNSMIFAGAEICALIIISLWPDISLFIPRALGYIF